MFRNVIARGAPVFSSFILNNALTVLNYHRIVNPHTPGFDTLKANVSASPEQFDRQMAHVAKRYNVVTIEHLAAFLKGKDKLPERAAMITFDDGYHDNLSNAHPILMAHNLPAVIFLATDYIGRTTPFYWDLVAYCFFHSKKNSAVLPVTGFRSWGDESAREKVALEWVEAVKRIPEADKQIAVVQLSSELEVSTSPDSFTNMFLNWDQVRYMSRNGIEFGAHTASHPILTRVSSEKARQEIVGSKERIETETGRNVIGFAYPNGGSDDFSLDITRIIRDSGIQAAFSLLPGPASYRSVTSQPFAIRRIFLIHSDSFDKFLLKLAGGARLNDMLGR